MSLIDRRHDEQVSEVREPRRVAAAGPLPPAWLYEGRTRTLGLILIAVGVLLFILGPLDRAVGPRRCCYY